MLVQRNDPKATAVAAKKTQRYLCDTFEFESSPPRYVNIYTPDGGVLRASTEADAQRICAELNALLIKLIKM